MKLLTFLIVTQVAGLSLADPQVKYLGLSLSPSVFPLRTALDVLQPLQPGLGYRFPVQLGGYGNPWVRWSGWSGWSGYPGYLPQPHLTVLPANTAVELEREVSPANPLEGVDVAEEMVEEEAAPGEIVIRRPVDSLPSLPASPFRDQRPVIPAGIAQATQPQFVHTIFKNPKVAPSLQFLINSKISPVLQEISSGVEKL